MAGTSTGGGVREGAGVGMGGGKQKSTLSPHIERDNVPACTLISALAVARNGRPKIIGMEGALIHIHYEEVAGNDKLTHLNWNVF